ncbi:MAG: hypothetical protein Greene041619_92 [Candidatus Peregrinibacteria bacterium Greene0416_19]|nr:MAG: hypothetical protein Greene041619_92 [Candidatus Peregrinibacteria bacterium Greene0416_19]
MLLGFAYDAEKVNTPTNACDLEGKPPIDLDRHLTEVELRYDIAGGRRRVYASVCNFDSWGE